MTHFPKAPNHARYKPGAAIQNRYLLAALLHVWGQRCYICSAVKDNSDYEVEHLVPRSFVKEEVRKLLDEYGSPEVKALLFDVDAPHNLAPVCGRCNSEKSDMDLVGSNRMMVLLERARKFEPLVVDRVRLLRSKGKVVEALSAIAIADISDPASRDALLKLGPEVVNKLRVAAPQTLMGPSNYDYDDPYADSQEWVSATLDEQGRRARVICEDVHEGDFDGLLGAAVGEVKSAIRNRLTDDICADLSADGHEYADLGGVAGRLHMVIDQLRYKVGEEAFEVSGNFFADGSTDVAVPDISADSGTVWMQRDADPIEGTFTVDVWFQSGKAEVGDAELGVEDWSQDEDSSND